MNEQIKKILTECLDDCETEAQNARAAMEREDRPRAKQLLLRTISLTCEVLETLTEHGTVEQLITLYPNLGFFVRQLELVDNGDFGAALRLVLR